MFPETRLRRLRQSPGIRRMLDAPFPGAEKFMWPAFVVDGVGTREPIGSMPGQCRLGIDQLLRDLDPLAEAGLGSVLLFGLAAEERKDACGTEAFNENGTVQRAIAAVKQAFPDLPVAADVRACAYTTHGHCGPLDARGEVDHDAALAVLAKAAASHAAAGADILISYWANQYGEFFKDGP